MSRVDRERTRKHGMYKRDIGASPDEIERNVRDYGTDLGLSEDDVFNILRELGINPQPRLRPQFG